MHVGGKGEHNIVGVTALDLRVEMIVFLSLDKSWIVAHGVVRHPIMRIYRA